MSEKITMDMFSSHVVAWAHLFKDCIGKPTTYLEVGSYEGASLCWMLRHILNHEGSTAIAIDTWDVLPDWPEHTAEKWAEVEATWSDNVLRTGLAGRVAKVKADSVVGLAAMRRGSVDIAYVDGSHRAADCLADMLLCWRTLKPGGILLVDDVEGWSHPEWSPHDNPMTACKAFAAATGTTWSRVEPGQWMFVKP